MGKNETENNRKEIDLLELFSMMGSGIKNFILNIYNAAWWLFVFGIKNYLYIIIAAAIGLGYGLYHLNSFEPGYESQMKIRTNSMRSYEMKTYFDEISDYLSERTPENSELIRPFFDLDSATFSKLLQIKGCYYIDVHSNGTIDAVDIKNQRSLEDTINIRDSLHLCIIATVKDPLIFPLISKGIEHYIQSKQYIQEQNAFRLEELQNNKLQLLHEVEYLDSLQRVVYFNTPNAPSIRQNNTGFFLGNVSVQLFHDYKERLNKKIQLIDTELKLHKKSYSVLSDFKISTEKTTTNLIIIVKPIVYLGFFGYLLALFIYFFRRNYKNYAAKID